MTAAAPAHTHQASFASLFISAVGIVFGDIGTSPLYAVKETVAGHHPLPIDRLHVLGVLSLIVWALLIVVSIKYVVIIMRADNRGEGGSLALLALLARRGGEVGSAAAVGTLGLCAAALFYGDSVITPAISVLSAVEGIEVADPRLSVLVGPLTILILVLLFAIQRSGTAVVGTLFGPVMVVWFATLAALGVVNIGRAPEVLWALSPHHALRFFLDEGTAGFLALGSVVLAVTGAEALYADMGHFGRGPIRVAWYVLVWPALLLNYFGQGALILSDPTAADSPFFRLAPDWATLPLVVLATMATVIASQAVISGAFSITRQAVQLGYLPRLIITHTSAQTEGQIYIPIVNWALLAMVVALVIGFESSSNLAAAYGIAVTGTMVITTVLAAIVMRHLWGWRRGTVIALTSLFLLVDGAFFLANIPKIPHGGWFPLAMGAVVYAVLTTWKQGRACLRELTQRDAIPVATVLDRLGDLPRARGTAVYLAGTRFGTPAAFLHNLKHNQVLHDRVVLLTVEIDDTPYVAGERRIESKTLRDGMLRVVVHYGFMEDPDIPKAFANAREAELGFYYDPFSTSYFVSRVIVRPTGRSTMVPWRAALFAWLVQNAAASTDFFHLPTNRVVELGANVEV
ncbi:potassium transporter Kup [Azospirillum sp. A39]|uniref:potassium transporter Kup n=1 Tax=Azospirillum sp. A39 TaxID=3462279 RepID=UPI00404686ED